MDEADGNLSPARGVVHVSDPDRGILCNARPNWGVAHHGVTGNSRSSEMAAGGYIWGRRWTTPPVQAHRYSVN